MKKTSIALMMVIIIALSSCAGNSNYTTGEPLMDTWKNGNMGGDWPVYSNATELTNKAELVFIGKITGVSFTVFDITTGHPPTEKTEDRHRELITLYEFEVIEIYKGNVSGVSRFWMSGGIVGYREDEQIKLMEEENVWEREYGIFMWEGLRKYEIGEPYLFALRHRDNILPYLLNLEQSVYSLKDPTRNHTYGISDGQIYYSGNRCQYGYPLISPRDIISTFGEQAWEAFYTEWQKSDSVYRAQQSS